MIEKSIEIVILRKQKRQQISSKLFFNLIYNSFSLYSIKHIGLLQIKMEVPIIVKLDGKSIHVRANSDWSIYQLKQHIYFHCFEKAENLKIIFAGTEVKDSVLLKVYFIVN